MLHHNTVIFQNLAISTNDDEIDFQTSVEDGKYLLDNIRSDVIAVFVSANNIDWRGNIGYKIFDPFEDTEKFWQEIAGIDGEWTLDVQKATRNKVDAICYSHDTPTGGKRVARFITPDWVIQKFYAEDGKQDLANALDEMGYMTAEDRAKPSKAKLREALRGIHIRDLQDLFESWA